MTKVTDAAFVTSVTYVTFVTFRVGRGRRAYSAIRSNSTFEGTSGATHISRASQSMITPNTLSTCNSAGRLGSGERQIAPYFASLAATPTPDSSRSSSRKWASTMASGQELT